MSKNNVKEVIQLRLVKCNIVRKFYQLVDLQGFIVFTPSNMSNRLILACLTYIWFQNIKSIKFESLFYILLEEEILFFRIIKFENKDLILFTLLQRGKPLDLVFNFVNAYIEKGLFYTNFSKQKMEKGRYFKEVRKGSFFKNLMGRDEL